MSFCEFKGIWKVTEVTDLNETLGHSIAIGGSPTAVQIICIDAKDSHKYDGFTYQPHPEQLVLDLSTIQLKRGAPNEIFFTSPLAPGSWTAEDNNGGDGK
jgi:hypothetical protein